MVAGLCKCICCAGIGVISQESIYVYSLQSLVYKYTIYTRNVHLGTHGANYLGPVDWMS